MRGILGALLFGLLLMTALASRASSIRVYYDAGWGNRIALRGDKAPFSWTAGVAATWTSGNAWVYSWPDSVGDVQLKPMINDATWSIGANYRVKAGTSVDIYPYFQSRNGTLQKVNNFWSPQLGNGRTLAIYLPPSYVQNPLKRYPVLYMHDGQNLFEAPTAFGGVEWRVDETANDLINRGLMDEVIVVGIYNAGANRIYEYTPCCDAGYGGGGADTYEAFLLQSVKPYVDRTYRTLAPNRNTAIMGSSLGGLVSFYIGRRHPEVFGKAAGLSSSFWWDDSALARQVEAATQKVPIRIYLDAGTNSDGLEGTTRMRDALVQDGYVQGQDLDFYVAQGAGHNESSWAARLGIPLTYLFPWQSTQY